MNSKRSHNFIKAILFALTLTLVMTGAAFGWGQVYADEGTGSGAYSDMQNYDAAPAERVYGIYMLFGDDPRVYVEWLGETELPEDAVLVIEKKEEMTEEEAAEYQAAFDELIGKRGGGDGGADGNAGASDPGGDPYDGDATDGDADAGDNDDAADAGEPDELEEQGTEDVGGPNEPDTEESDDTNPGESNEFEEQGADKTPEVEDGAAETPASGYKGVPKDASQAAAKQAAKQVARMMNAANVPKENAQDATAPDGGTRDIVPTGIFTGSRLGMILVVLLVAFASAIFFIRSRNQDEY